jgi:hypothetical protein
MRHFREWAASVEERFWPSVWKCAHGNSCKRCCWPWVPGVNLEMPTLSTWEQRIWFFDPRLAPSKTMPVYRAAYALTHQTLFLWPSMPVCHQCDFAPCCNWHHLTLGTQGDNKRDLRGKSRHTGEGYPVVTLPDGRVWRHPGEIPEALLEAVGV